MGGAKSIQRSLTEQRNPATARWSDTKSGRHSWTEQRNHATARWSDTKSGRHSWTEQRKHATAKWSERDRLFVCLRLPAVWWCFLVLRAQVLPSRLHLHQQRW